MAGPRGDPGEWTVEELLAELTQGDMKKRSHVAAALGRSGDPRAVGPLVALLAEQSPRLKEAAAYALGRMGKMQAGGERSQSTAPRPALTRELQDQRAVEALVALLAPNPPVVDRRMALLEGKSNFRLAAVRALGKFGNPLAVQPLFAALSDDDEEVRDAAENALKRIRREGAVEIGGQFHGGIDDLVQTLREGDAYARMNSARTLESLGWQPLDSQQRALRVFFLNKWEEVFELEDQAVDAIIALFPLFPSYPMLNESVFSMAEAGDQRAIKLLIAGLSIAYESTEHSFPLPWRQYQDIVWVLARMGYREALGSLIRHCLQGVHDVDAAVSDRWRTDEARDLLSATEQVLKRNLADVSVDELTTIASISTVVQHNRFEYEPYGRSATGSETVEVDAAALRQCARRELDRRQFNREWNPGGQWRPRGRWRRRSV